MVVGDAATAALARPHRERHRRCCRCCRTRRCSLLSRGRRQTTDAARGRKSRPKPESRPSSRSVEVRNSTALKYGNIVVVSQTRHLRRPATSASDQQRAARPKQARIVKRRRRSVGWLVERTAGRAGPLPNAYRARLAGDQQKNIKDQKIEGSKRCQKIAAGSFCARRPFSAYAAVPPKEQSVAGCLSSTWTTMNCFFVPFSSLFAHWLILSTCDHMRPPSVLSTVTSATPLRLLSKAEHHIPASRRGLSASLRVARRSTNWTSRLDGLLVVDQIGCGYLHVIIYT